MQYKIHMLSKEFIHDKDCTHGRYDTIKKQCN